MKHTWPPMEERGWMIQQQKLKGSEIYFPMVPHQKTLFAFRAIGESAKGHSLDFSIEMATGRQLNWKGTEGEWTQLPYPIECHTIGSFWKSLKSSKPLESIEWGFYDVYLNTFRMRALVNEFGKMNYGYRLNKNGQLMGFTAYKNEIMTLPEDTYIIYPTKCLNEKIAEFREAKQTIEVEKDDDSL